MMPASLADQGLSLRTEEVWDDAFLLALYRSTREAEMALFGWSEEQKHLFIAQQFEAQRRHYRQTMAGCSFDVIERRGAPIGRLYVEERESQLHIVDVALIPEERGHGIGTALLQGLIARAAAMNKAVGIFVEHANPAQSLYRRLGFVPLGDHGFYIEMTCPSPEAVS